MKATLVLLLGWLLGAGAALAQPAPASGPARIDSRDECRALGGAWVGRDGWQFACQVGWERADCLRLGGSWTPMVAAPGNGVCMARVSDAAIARQCNDSGGSWGPPGSAMPYCQPGTPSRTVAAVRQAPDANKLCDSQRDCTYGCVYQGPPAAEGANVLGRCRANNARTGCFTMVEKGRLSGQICLD